MNKKMKTKKNVKQSSESCAIDPVGGQAVIEGVLMRSKFHYAVAVRRSSGKIETMTGPVETLADKFRFLKWPVIRGVVGLFESMGLGFKALDWSANKAEEDWEKEDEKRKTQNTKKTDSKPKKVLTPEEKKRQDAISSFLSFAFAIAMAVIIFIWAPVQTTKWMGKSFPALQKSSIWFNLIVVTIKLFFFFMYVWLISLMKDVKRLFQYHGAEHKTIYAYEDGKTLTFANMKGYTTRHPRCGTSFMFITLAISLVLFILFLPPKYPIWLRILIEIPLILPIAGISYEVLKLSAKYRDNIFMKLFIAPGLGFQYITTQEPDAKQLEVAVASLNAVLKEDSKIEKFKHSKSKQKIHQTVKSKKKKQTAKKVSKEKKKKAVKKQVKKNAKAKKRV